MNKALIAALLAFLAPLSHAAIIQYTAALGPEVSGATGSGSVRVDYDTEAHTLLIAAEWSGLSGTTTVAHIHCCTNSSGAGTVGVAVTPGTLPGFPVGLAAGSYTSPLIDLDIATSFTAGFVNTFGGGTTTGAIAALLSGIDANTAYFNIHSTTFPPGEIRGFLQQVPEPGTVLLTGLALAGLAFSRRRFTPKGK